MDCIGVFVNFEKPRVVKIARQIVEWLQQHGKKVLTSGAGPSPLVNHGIPTCSEQEMARQAQCIIVLGGDGTLLSSARSFSIQGIPLFGVNLGQLGFLTEIELPDLIPALEKLIAGQFEIEERMMLQAEVCRNGKEIAKFYGLNDAVITKGAFARLVRLKTLVDDEHVDIYPADGLIISSPTGSTAYSLSAGGPLVVPTLELMIVTPICPHTLYSRPIIIDRDSVVKVELQETLAEVMLTIDGQSGFLLEPYDAVTVKKAPFKARLMKLHRRSYYDILRVRLKEGGSTDV